ncbi:hypothetical protein FACS189468_6440 [Spirochaetia bacterium]|nr:hypothetical protein FACS189468_6440 [Spirochaetia bacterium]
MGGTLAADYALPFSALTLGLESGFLHAKATTIDSSFNLVTGGIGVIPILLRIGYHPDVGIEKLDVYALAKLGYGIGFLTGDSKGNGKPKGFAYGFDIGARYFFTKSIGAFAEGGYEYYFLRDSGLSSSYANRFVTAGVTFKL